MPPRKAWSHRKQKRNTISFPKCLSSLMMWLLNPLIDWLDDASVRQLRLTCTDIYDLVEPHVWKYYMMKSRNRMSPYFLCKLGIAPCFINVPIPAEATHIAGSLGYLHVIEWIQTHHPDSFDQASVDHAAASGNYELIEWFKTTRNENFTVNALELTCKEGNFEALQILVQLAYASPLYETLIAGLHSSDCPRLIDIACETFEPENVAWMFEHLPYETLVTSAAVTKTLASNFCEDAKLATLKILFAHNVVADSDAMEYTCTKFYGVLGLLKFLYRHSTKLPLSARTLFCLAQNKDYAAIHWVIKNKIVETISNEAFDIFIKDNAIKTCGLVVKFYPECIGTFTLVSAFRKTRFDIAHRILNAKQPIDDIDAINLLDNMFAIAKNACCLHQTGIIKILLKVYNIKELLSNCVYAQSVMRKILFTQICSKLGQIFDKYDISCDVEDYDSTFDDPPYDYYDEYGLYSSDDEGYRRRHR